MSGQTKLKSLYLNSRDLIFPRSLPHQIIIKNSNTLEYLDITGLNLSPADPPFDLSIFRNYLKLMKLAIVIGVDSIIERTNPNEPDVINFHRLPKTLALLHIGRLKILSVEVLIAFQPENALCGTNGFPALEQFYLIGCSDKGLLGINAIVMSKIMLKPRPNLISVHFHMSAHKDQETNEIWFNQLKLSANRCLVAWKTLDKDYWGNSFQKV